MSPLNSVALRDFPANSARDARYSMGPGTNADSFFGITSENVQWAHLLGQPRPDFPAPPPLQGATHITQHLPAAFHGQNEFLGGRMFHLETLMGGFWLEISPLVEVNDINFIWTETVFASHVADTVPHEATPRVVEYSDRKYQAKIDRKGIGFRLERDFVQTPVGREKFFNCLIAMGKAVDSAIKLEIARKIRTATEIFPSGIGSDGSYKPDGCMDDASIHELMQDGVDNWYILLKGRALPGLMSEVRNHIRRVNGDLPDTMLVPEAVRDYLVQQDPELTTNKGSGPLAARGAQRDPTTLSNYLGLTLFPVQTYLDPDYNFDPMLTDSTIGEFYVCRSHIPADYTSRCAQLQIYDEDNNRWYTLTPEVVLEKSGHFNLKGDPDAWNKKYDNTLANAPKPNYTEKDLDGMFLYNREGANRTPIDNVGEIRGKHLSMDTFTDIVNVTLRSLGSKGPSVEASLVELKGIVDRWAGITDRNKIEASVRPFDENKDIPLPGRVGYEHFKELESASVTGNLEIDKKTIVQHMPQFRYLVGQMVGVFGETNLIKAEPRVRGKKRGDVYAYLWDLIMTPNLLFYKKSGPPSQTRAARIVRLTAGDDQATSLANWLTEQQSPVSGLQPAEEAFFHDQFSIVKRGFDHVSNATATGNAYAQLVLAVVAHTLNALLKDSSFDMAKFSAEGIKAFATTQKYLKPMQKTHTEMSLKAVVKSATTGISAVYGLDEDKKDLNTKFASDVVDEYWGQFGNDNDSSHGDHDDHDADVRSVAAITAFREDIGTNDGFWFTEDQIKAASFSTNNTFKTPHLHYNKKYNDTEGIKERFQHAMDDGSLVFRAAAMFYLNQPITRDAMKRLVTKNIPLPFGYIAMRDQMSYTTAGIVVMKRGAETMMTARKRGNFAMTEIVANGIIEGNYTGYHGVIVKKPENIYNINYALPAGYNGGRGVGFYADIKDNTYSFEKKNRGNGNLFVVLCPRSDCDTIKSPLSLTGYFHMHDRKCDDASIQENQDGVHYNMAPWMVAKWNLVAKNFSRTGYRGPEAADVPPNEVLYLGTNRAWNSAVNQWSDMERGNGHLAGIAGPGANAITSGKLLIDNIFEMGLAGTTRL